MPSDLILTCSSLSMTSLEISALVESRHDKVKQSIERLAERGVIVLPPLGDVPFVDDSGRNRTTSAYVFHGEQGKRDSIVVVAQLSPEFTGRLVDRWQALESGEAKPAASVQPKARPREIREAFACCLSIAKAIGLKGNPAALAADIGTRKLTGQSALALIDQTHLKADPQGQSYTPTDLGKMLDPPLSARKFNALLEDRGLQTRDIAGNPIPTDSADGMYEWLDTNKRRTDGVPVKQLKWFSAVLHSLGVIH